MSDVQKEIRVVITSSGAKSGATDVVNQLDRIIAKGKITGAANDNLAGSFTDVGKAANSAANQGKVFDRQLDSTKNSANAAGKAVKNLRADFVSLKGVLAALGLGLVAKQFMSFSDDASSMSAKLTLATEKMGSLAQANKDVSNIANKTRSDIRAVTDLYSTLALQATTLKISQDQVATATSTVGMALKISGSNADQAKSAILQLSQAFGSGKLSGDEFASMSENAKRIMNLLADSMGVPRGALKDLASQGKITSAVLIKAFTDPKMVASIEKEFGKIPVTFGDIKTAASNMAIQVTGSFAKGFGIADSLAVIVAKVQSWATSMVPQFETIGKAARQAFDGIMPVLSVVGGAAGSAIQFITTNMGALISVTQAAVLGFVAFKAVAAGQWVAGAVAQIINLQRALGATNVFSALFSAGMKGAQMAVNGFTASLLANPFTAIAAALTITLTLLWKFRDSIMLGGGSLASLGDLGRAAFEGIGGFIKNVSAIASAVTKSISEFFSNSFGAIGKFAANMFGDLDFSLLGVMRMAAKVTDFVMDTFVAAFRTIVAYYSGLPKAMSTIFVNAFNGATTIIEDFINKAVGGINMIIGVANKMGGSFDLVADVKLGRLEGGGAITLGSEMGAAWSSGFSGNASKALESTVKRADEIAKKRLAKTKADEAAAAKPPPSAAAAAAPGKKDDKADSDAKKRIQNEKDFWKTLENQVATAGMLPIAAANYSKELELQKILNRQLLPLEKERVATLLQQERSAKFLTGSLDARNKSAADYAKEEELFRKRQLGMSEDQLTVERAVLTFRNNALAEGLSIQDATVIAEEALVRASAARGVQIDRNNDLMNKGVELAKKYSKTYAAAQVAKGFADERKALDAQYAGGANPEFTKVMYDEAVTALGAASRAAANTFHDVFGQKIVALGDQLGGTFGSAISQFGALLSNLTKAASGDFSGMGPIGALLDVFGSTNSKFFTGLTDAAKTSSQGTLDGLLSSNTWKKPMESMATGFGDLKKSFSGPNGNFMKGLGTVMGRASAGMAIGSATNSVMSAMGMKTSNTGAQLGGALGSVLGGPIGSLIGSIGGSLLGGLFKKAKYGTASFGMGSNGELTSTVGGNKTQGATGAAAEVISGLESIASQLGGAVTGVPNLSIGTYKDKWRVSASGKTGKLKGGDVVDFGKDGAEAAIKFAIQDAVKDGAITGISEFSKRVLGSMDVDKAMNLANSYESILKDLAAFENPIKAAVDGTVKSIDTLIQQMQKAGATTEELANVEKWRVMKLDEVLKEQLGGFQSVLDTLTGSAGGFSALSQLTDNLSKMDKFKVDLAAGKAVDQTEYVNLANKILSGAGEIYDPNSAKYQAIAGELRDLTTTAMANVTDSFNAAKAAGLSTTEAINSSATATQELQKQANDYLSIIAQAVTNGGLGGSSNSTGNNLNGRLVVAG